MTMVCPKQHKPLLCYLNLQTYDAVMSGGYGAEDRRLMTKKIEFLSTVGHHENIVRFVGSYNDPDDQG